MVASEVLLLSLSLSLRIVSFMGVRVDAEEVGDAYIRATSVNTYTIRLVLPVILIN